MPGAVAHRGILRRPAVTAIGGVSPEAFDAPRREAQICLPLPQKESDLRRQTMPNINFNVVSRRIIWTLRSAQFATGGRFQVKNHLVEGAIIAGRPIRLRTRAIKVINTWRPCQRLGFEGTPDGGVKVHGDRAWSIITGPQCFLLRRGNRNPVNRSIP